MKKFWAWLADFIWYKDQFIAVWLMPFSLIFTDISRFRRYLYRKGILSTQALSVPVIIVGNITVGGTGKTPLVIWIASFLKQAGYRPGVISRGYAGTEEQWPQKVNADSDPEKTGDEPVLIARNASVPVVVGPSRVDDAKLLLQRDECNIIISDDGLQHYALARDIEIVVIDGERRFGNGNCLPAGPLREPVSRLQEVDLIVCNGEAASDQEYSMFLKGDTAVNLATGQHRPLAEFAGINCHALAGIGNPQRFFNMLKSKGLNCKPHRFPDHYSYRQDDIYFGDDDPVFMTEKDAVKCTRFANQKHWYVPVQADLPETFKKTFLQLLKEKTDG